MVVFEGDEKTVLSQWAACGYFLAEVWMRTALGFDLLTVLD